MFLFSMLLLSPNRFANIFKSRLLQQIGKFSFGFYLLHPFSIYLTVNHLSKLLPIDNDFSGLFWILTLLYWFSKCFYYLVEFPLNKVADYCCKRISSKEYFLQKNVLEICLNYNSFEEFSIEEDHWNKVVVSVNTPRSEKPQ